MTIKANLYCFQTTLRSHDTYLQLRGQGRPRQPGQDHHHHGELRVRGPGPVSDQHEVGGGCNYQMVIRARLSQSVPRHDQ